ncbi:PREDICTED: taste receptor type 1 member 3 [Bison bison bison]|uniref:Taste receptor type 1 member 3 n=1 Tax=Bison bison bison TaxID=43346 RepID=A0A6P3I9U5_BISBB|nr:PREDICTED: taste receptor type 1 member 3 [Bison bison bison]
MPPAMLGLTFLGLVAALGIRPGAPLCLSQQLSLPGDYILGGLFPLGSADDTGLGDRTQPNATVCTRLSAPGLLWALAVMMAVEEINNASTLLPGLRLGYDLFDTCSEPVVAMKPSLVFMAKAGSRSIGAYCDYTQYQPRVLAVIGPHSSEVALVTGKFFSFFLMPQVSYGATTDRLSNRETFPSFFRTVPSDRVQAIAMVELLRGLHWNWVAAVGSDDEYGRQGLGLFSSLANAKGICIAYEGLMPLPRAGGMRLGSVQSLLHQVNHSSVQVGVFFPPPKAPYSLFSYSIHYRLSPKVWVASEAWLTSSLVMTLPGMDRVGTVLGFLHQGAEMPEFRSYVQTRLARAAEPAYCASLEAGRLGLEEHVVGPRCPQCDRASPENVTDGLLYHQTFAAYAAVYSVAHALHKALLCNSSGCLAQEPVRPWQLLDNMYNMSFHAYNRTLQFDTSGNVDLAYDLKLWVWRDRMPMLRTVGSFNGSLELQFSSMIWHTPGNQEPVSQCSRQCREGQVRRVKGFHSCCYDCVDCKAGSYQRHPGEPSGTASCMGQQLLLHLPLTGCLSTLFLLAAEIFVGSELPPSWTDWLHSCLRGPWAWLVVLLAMLAEAALCSWYLAVFPPVVVTNWHALPTEALVHCRVSSWIMFGVVHATNAMLAFLCFLGTFLVQSRPGHYNSARGLTFAMLAYFITWVSYIPLFANVHVVSHPPVQMGTILFCVLGILTTFHLPKCYLLLWRPDLNTPEFFLGGGPSDARGQGGSGHGEETQGKNK